jgi:hypothetical protein
LASVVAWLLGALASIGVGLVALSLIGDGLTARTVQPLARDAVVIEVRAPTSTHPATPAAARPTPDRTVRPSPSGMADERIFSSSGGSAIARCDDGGAYLVSWSPEQGYRVVDVRRGPTYEARVIFDGHRRRITLSIRCADGTPHASVDQGYGPRPSGSRHPWRRRG